MDGGNRGKKLEIPKEEFSSSVIVLRSGLGRVSATMKLKVQLPMPSWKRVGLFFQLVEEIVRCAAEMNSREKPRGVGEASQSPKSLNLLPGRAATAITFPKLEGCQSAINE